MPFQAIKTRSSKGRKFARFPKEINGFMLDVTDQYCIFPAAGKGGFSCHPGDLSRKCHLVTGHVSHGSEAEGLLPRTTR